MRKKSSAVEDETLAIASLLNVNPAKFIRLAPQQWMKSLLLAVGQIPGEIIFLAGEKLSDTGFSWAPTTLMGHSAGIGSVENADVTSTGLYAVYVALRFQTTTVDAQRIVRLFFSVEEDLYVEVDNDTHPFECDAILLSRPLISLDPVQGVALLVTGVDPSEDEGLGVDRLVCKCQKRLTLSPTSSELQKEGLTEKEVLCVQAKYGALRVKLV
ncbi:hypothetical protein EDC04DRAFT_58197 [Pisolithus marmoratus]|nr:hypothetical protein EDC04DRAFT_58197 [Pisolithus marmoratus]